MRRALPEQSNIVLIGMPGVGKSTVGVLLAKLTSRDFLDTDVYIQSREQRRLQDLLDRDGKAAFCRMEERQVLSLHVNHHVIATGGSVVYSETAMRHLRQRAATVYMTLPLILLEQRLNNLPTRGVVREAHQNLSDLFVERDPLYRRHADILVDCEGKNHEETAIAIIEALHVP